MTNKTFALFALSVFVFAFLVAGVSAETVTFALTADDLGVSTNANLAGAFTSSAAITPASNPTNNAADGAETTDWTTNAAVDTTDFYNIALTAQPGFDFVVTAMTFKHRADDATTPMLFVINYSNDNFATSKTITTSAVSSSDTEGTFTTSSIKLPVSSANPLAVRIFAYDADTNTEVFSVKDMVITADIVPEEVIACVLSGNSLNNLVLEDIELSVEDGYGEDDEWFPFDSVSAETNVEYDTNDDFELGDIEVTWMLFDSAGINQVIDGDESVSDLQGGEDADVLIQFNLDEDVEDMNDADSFYVIVEADDEEITSGDSTVCDYVKVDVNMQSEDTIILDNIQAPTTAVQCSAEVLVTADIWNIGGDDQEDVYITVQNSELGINNQRIEVGDVDSFEDAALDFTFTVPSGAAEKSYNLVFGIYDEDEDVFEINYDESEFIVPVSVSGNCIGGSSSSGTASVSANLVSGGKAGQPMVVTAKITNAGTSSANYTINAAGFGSWASGATLSETSFMLGAGQSKDVTITLATLKTASGEQTFNVEVVSGNQLVTTQPVTVALASAGFLSGITGGAVGGNGTIWVIGLVNVILVLAIIMVAVRFFRK